MAITVDEKGLSARQKFIRDILSPLNRQIATGSKRNHDSITWYAKDPSSTDDYKTLFKTSNSDIKANYFEVWVKSASREWTLKHLYFHVKLKNDVNDYCELLAFHIDMLDNSGNCYKKHPHIHIKHPKYESISNAHLAFNLDNLGDTTSCLENFNKNISSIMEMVKKEFIQDFKKS